MKRLTSIGISSVFKISLVLGASAGLLVGLVLMIVDFTSSRYMEGIVTLFLAPVLYGVMGALVNSMMAWVYNKVSERMGGIEFNIEE